MHTPPRPAHAVRRAPADAPPQRSDVDGLRAWTVVAAATVAAAVGLGTVTSHGVLVAALLPLTIGGVGAGAALVAISTTLQFGLGPIVGRVTDRLGVQRVTLLAAGAFGAGAALAAASPHPTVGILTYAVGTGVAGACTLAPLVATVAGWCVRRRTAAIGILSAGNGVGALLLAPWLATAVDEQGLRTTWALLALVGTGTLLLSAAALRTPPGAPTRASGSPGLLTDPALRRFYLAGALGSGGVIVSLAYLVPYAGSLGLSPTRAAALLGATGAIGIVSRLATSVVPARSAFRTYRVTQLVVAASGLAWVLAPGDPRLLYVFVGVFGLGSGLWAALAPLVVAEAHPERLASLLGVLYTSPALGGAIGPLLAGVLLRCAPLAAVGSLLTVCLLLAHGVLRPLSKPLGPSAAPPNHEEV